VAEEFLAAEAGSPGSPGPGGPGDGAAAGRDLSWYGDSAYGTGDLRRRTRVATFGLLCRTCPLRARCTTSKTGRKLVLHPRDDLLSGTRADWAASSGLRKDYMTYRPTVERAIAQVATWRGRRLKLRGTAKNNAWLKRRTAGLNLRNLIGKGLARRDGAWALAT
jgi:Transposase DDE domain